MSDLTLTFSPPPPRRYPKLMLVAFRTSVYVGVQGLFRHEVDLMSSDVNVMERYVPSGAETGDGVSAFRPCVRLWAE